MRTPFFFLTMSAVSVLKGIHHEFKNNIQNKYSYKVDIVFDNVLPQQRIGKTLSIQLVKNPIYFIDKVYFKKTNTAWMNNMATVAFDMDVTIIDDPWFSPPNEDYPLGYIECSVDNIVIKSKPLILNRAVFPSF